MTAIQSSAARAAHSVGSSTLWIFLLTSVLVSTQAPAALKVAVFEADATPPLGHPLYPSFKPLAEVQEPLLAKGVILDDGRNRYVLCAIDWCTLGGSSRELLLQQMAAAAGTQRAFCTVHCVHQHSAPGLDIAALDLLETLASPPPYLQRGFHNAVLTRISSAVKEAVARLEPCDQIGTGQAKVERVASNRRIPGPDGKVVPRLSSTRNKPALRDAPEGLIDPILRTITFARCNRPLVRLHFYATHPQSYYGDPRASRDFVGVARERLQEEEDVFQIYFTGCSGDIAAGKYNDGTREAREQLTERIYAGLRAAAASTRYEPAGPLVWRSTPVTFQPRVDAHYEPSVLRAQMADPEESRNLRTRAARCLVYQERGDLPIELGSLQINGVCLLFLPGEPMVEFQLYAQRRKPEAFVAVAGYGDANPSYICTDETFPQEGYEAWATLVAPGSEARLKAAIDRLLGFDVP